MCHKQRYELAGYVCRKDKQTEDAESFKKAFARLDGAKEVSDLFEDVCWMLKDGTVNYIS